MVDTINRAVLNLFDITEAEEYSKYNFTNKESGKTYKTRLPYFLRRILEREFFPNSCTMLSFYLENGQVSSYELLNKFFSYKGFYIENDTIRFSEKPNIIIETDLVNTRCLREGKAKTYAFYFLAQTILPLLKDESNSLSTFLCFFDIGKDLTKSTFSFDPETQKIKALEVGFSIFDKKEYFTFSSEHSTLQTLKGKVEVGNSGVFVLDQSILEKVSSAKFFKALPKLETPSLVKGDVFQYNEEDLSTVPSFYE